MASRFATEGMRVVLADIERDALEVAARELAGDGHEVIAVTTDVGDAASVEALATRTIDAFGAVHLVCNNAGVGAAALPAWEMPPDAWDWMINVNLYGVIHGIRSFVPLLVAQNEGHVVNTTSIAGVVTGVGSGPYTATKHAVTALTETLQKELEVVDAAVGVSLVVPGRIDTRISEALRNWPAHYGPPPEVRQEESLGLMPIPAEFGSMVTELMDPADVAELVLEAVLNDRFWILTHPEAVAALVRKRCDAITDMEGAQR